MPPQHPIPSHPIQSLRISRSPQLHPPPPLHPFPPEIPPRFRLVANQMPTKRNDTWCVGGAEREREREAKKPTPNRNKNARHERKNSPRQTCIYVQGCLPPPPPTVRTRAPNIEIKVVATLKASQFSPVPAQKKEGVIQEKK